MIKRTLSMQSYDKYINYPLPIRSFRTSDALSNYLTNSYELEGEIIKIINIIFITILLSSLALAIGTYPPVTSDMVLYYHFNNQSVYGENNTNVYDFSGNGNNGTITTAIWNSSGGYLNDGSYNFNGVSDAIIVPYNNSYNLSSSLTVSVFLKRFYAQNLKGILAKGTNTISWQLQTSTTSGNTYRLLLYNSSGGANVLDGIPSNGLNIWDMFTFTYDGSTVLSYINGEYTGKSMNLSSLRTNSERLYIGNRSGNPYNGSIDELIIINKTLNKYDIRALYQNYITKLNYSSQNLPNGIINYSANSNIKVNESIGYFQDLGNVNYYSFSNANSYFNISNFTSRLFTNELTISFAYKSNYIDTFDNYPLNSLKNNDEWYITTKSNNTDFVFNFGLYNSTNELIYRTIIIPHKYYSDINKWRFLTVTFQNNNSLSTNIHIYVDGIKQSDGYLQNITVNYTISDINKLGITYYNASLAEIKISNKWLTNTQVNQLYDESMFGNNLGIGVPVIYYHDVNNTINNSITMNYSLFKEQMNYLNASGFHTITVQQFKNYTLGLYTLPLKPIIIMFDDAFKGVLDCAKPIMDNYSFVGVVSVEEAFLGGCLPYTDSDAGCRPVMNWSHISNLSNSSWEIASHSVSHTSFNTLNYSQRIYELNQSRYDIYNNIGIMPKSFTFPVTSNQSASQLEECSLFYDSCSGLQTYSNNNYKRNGSIGIRRRGITNAFDLTLFKTVIGLEDGLIFKVNFDLNSTTQIDKISNNTYQVINATFHNDTNKEIVLYNLSNALIYFSNNTGYVASINNTFTLFPYNYSYVLDNFNITEGISRDYSPIIFSSSSSTSKVLSSNLSSSINATVVINVNNCNQANTQIRQDGVSQAFTCLGLSQAQLYLTIPSGSSLLTIDNTCVLNNSDVSTNRTIFFMMVIITVAGIWAYFTGSDAMKLSALILFIVGIVIWLSVLSIQLTSMC